MKTISPTLRSYKSLDDAYDHFNEVLFEGSLPACLITFQRKKNACGYFCGGVFANMTDKNEVTDEIALNPQTFSVRSPEQILSTLVHEMCHLWQHHFGKRPSRCYHDRQWAQKMEEVGLIPSSTGMPGGKKTGQKMTHYIEENGSFVYSLQSLGPVALFVDVDGLETDTEKEKKSSSKVKFTCQGCGQNAWAKPTASLMCGQCEEVMTSEESESEDD